MYIKLVVVVDLTFDRIQDVSYSLPTRNNPLTKEMPLNDNHHSHPLFTLIPGFQSGTYAMTSHQLACSAQLVGHHRGMAVPYSAQATIFFLKLFFYN